MQVTTSVHETLFGSMALRVVGDAPAGAVAGGRGDALPPTPPGAWPDVAASRSSCDEIPGDNENDDETSLDDGGAVGAAAAAGVAKGPGVAPTISFTSRFFSAACASAFPAAAALPYHLRASSLPAAVPIDSCERPSSIIAFTSPASPSLR